MERRPPEGALVGITMASLLLALCLLMPPVDAWVDEARFKLSCPQATCWHYWNGNCYCLVTNQKRSWSEALKFCKAYKFTELITFVSNEEKNWIISFPLDNFWTGLNNLEESGSFSGSEGTRANMKLPWLRLSHPIRPNTVYCVKVSKHRLVALDCNAKAHWICKRSAFVDRYQEHKGKVLLSPRDSAFQVHSDLVSAKAACLELREQCTGITFWNNSYALARGTVLIKSEESHSAAYIKSDCTLGYFGRDCSSVCSRCYGDELCNPYTGVCDHLHTCRAQDSPAVCERALTSVWCPNFSGWKYWENNCYYFSVEEEASWVDARKQCRRFRSADLLWIESKNEMDWIFSENSPSILWTGLNSRKQLHIWFWANMKSAAKELHWLKLEGNPSGRCVGLVSTNKIALKLKCEEKYKWICKRKEEDDLFDAYVDRFLSGPLEPIFYTYLSDAILDCLTDSSCTGIVQDYQYYRRTKGIDEIDTYEETATTYIKRVCSFGYYGDNCASQCKKCYGRFKCNSLTGGCPERMHCIGQYKGELCELGIRNPKCPQNAPWWFYDGHCYYFEKERKGQHAWASTQCSYYKDNNLARIDSEKEKEWIGTMMETESWIGLLQEGTSWKWSGGGEHLDPSKYKWLWDFPATANGCALMMRGGKLRAISCIEQHFYICEKEIAGVDLFIDYPGKIMLAVHPLAVYKDLDEARFHCVLNMNCTGISSWPKEHFLVIGMEMVTGSAHHIFRLKTSCLPGRHGYACAETCPTCRGSALCNMLTGFCDEKSTCLNQQSLETCSETTISERCPDMIKWRYWNRHCYYFLSYFGTWKEANTSCSRFRAAELLWIENEADLKWLRYFVEEPIWLGLQDLNKDKLWTWSYGDDATTALKWMDFSSVFRWKRCAALTNEGFIIQASCSEEKSWACKRPAERDLDVYTGFWDSVVISETPSSSANSTYNESREACIKEMTECIGYGLWQYGYFELNGHTLVGGAFAPSVTFLKSACDYGYYGSDCEAECPQCHWDKPCHPITGACESHIVCAAPESVGTCSFGLYSLKCSLGAGWWYWQENCYLIEKNRKVTWKEAQQLCQRFKGTRLLQLEDPAEKTWLKEMISEQMWIGMQWHTYKKQWQWADGARVNTEINWLKIEGDTDNGCGTLSKDTSVLQSAKCNEVFYFICQRPENVNIFQEYKSHIIPQRQKMLPTIFYSLESAQEECIFERTTCTAVVFSQGQYYTVSGKGVFKSINADDVLYLKTVCNPGFYGTNCQFLCKECSNNLPCNAITGECVATSLTKCSLDSSDPQCIDEVFINPCPKKPQWYYFSTSCYYVENVKTATWANARISCKGFKGTDLVKITNSHEKMWVQYQGDDSWIGLIFYKRTYQYFWVDRTSSVFQNAWVIRRNRRYTQSAYDCGIAFKRYLSVTDCGQQRKWFCERKTAVDLFTEHRGRAFYLPNREAPTYDSLDKAKKACLVFQTCTGVVDNGKHYMIHTSMELYNTRDKQVVTWIKSDCASGRFGEVCEKICRKCDDGTSCNPHTGLCGDSLFCSGNDPTFTCKKGTLFSGRCPVEDGWVYRDSNCYYIHKENQKNWREARDMCRQFRDTDLLWITSNTEKELLLSVLPEGDYWIGLYGNRFCTHLQWSNANVSYTYSEWLRKKSWTFLWNCCVHLLLSKGLMPGANCNRKKLWVCKRREEETMDFHTFGGYYLVGIAKEATVVIHKSLSEAIQHCRFERRLCTGVQRIRNKYITLFTKRLVLVRGDFANLYTAYLKSVCAPGYYGPMCSINCVCNGTENCNPLSGQCAENEQCNEDYLKNDCEKGVIHLKCPRDPGWWYWRDNCYYIERVKQLTWKEAKDFCMAYYETELIPPPQNIKEKIWLASMLKSAAWIGSIVPKPKDKSSSEVTDKKTPTCMQINRYGKFKQVYCSSLAGWVCKRSVDTKMFWEYPGRILIMPLGDKSYKNIEHAMSACLLEESCSGFSYWQEQYVPVSGKELIFTKSKYAAAYMKTACIETRHGAYCQKRCPKCLEDGPCNRLTGRCAGLVTCSEKHNLTLCEFKLRSKFCYHAWTYFSGNCYYISDFGKINQSDAEYMCGQYKASHLVFLTTFEEKDWVAKAIPKRVWIRGLGPAFKPKMWLPPTEQKLAQRDITDTEELCLQLESGLGYVMQAPCAHNASWVCEAQMAPEPVDAPYKWWASLVTSLLTTIVVLLVTVFLTYKYALWIPEITNEVIPETMPEA